MKGIQYVVDQQGNKNAVLIDLTRWRDLWEDMYHEMVSQARREDPQVSWEDLKAELDGDEQPDT